jgi:hypothetical protein
MQLYSKAIKGLVQDNAADMTITDDGEKIYRLSVDGKVKRTNLKDILASSFLKTPDNAVVAVYRNWNKDNSKGKYVGQRQHYTNIRWLTENDLIYIGNPEEKFLLSKLGDIYTFKMGWFRLIVETNSNFNLRRVMMRLKTTNSKGLASELANIHKLVGLYFVKRIDETYKYLVHKDGDLSNNHYRNLIWLKTLSGIHNDGVAYFEVPGCPDYVLSETNMPYSFKRGILSQLKIQMRGDGYYSLKLITKENKYCDFLYHRIVSATRNKDFDNKLVVDHGDRKRDNFQHTNLRAVTIKENNANSDPKRGKEIMQYDLKGNFMAKFPNSVTAAAVLGENFKGYNFSNCAKLNNNETGKTHTSEGFIWKYVINNKRYIPRQEETFRILRGVFQGKKIEYDNYMISNLGTVINVNNGYAKRITDSTYPYVNFSKNGKKKDKLIHFMVALLFVEGRTEEKCQVNHIDRNKKNFRFDNLEWVTPTENSLHSSYKNSLPVKKICMKTGDILGVYDSRKEGALSCGKTDASGIRKACNYKPLQSFGFYWEDVFEHELKNYPHLKINTEK